jgi:hypothetical protein
MNENIQLNHPLAPVASTALTVPSGSDQPSWEAGREAGLKWAADEARRGYLHPLTVKSPQQSRMLVHHARQAFGGLTHGRRHSFIRGFVAGVAEFWQAHEESARRVSSDTDLPVRRAGRS